MFEQNADMNIVGKISHFFTVNRPLSLLVLLTAVVFGVISFLLTPKQYNPEIVRPAFVVTLSYAGATTQESLERVVYELVEKVYAVPGVDDVYTEITDGSHITTTAIFTVGYDKTKAKVDLLTQLQQHSYLAQGFIGVPHIMEINPESIPVLQVVFGSANMDIVSLREKVVALSHELTNSSDVSDVSVVGGYTTALVVAVDPDKLQLHNITLQDVEHTLVGSAQRSVLQGYENDTHTIEIVFDSRAKSPDDIGSLQINNTVRIRDIASVYEGTAGNRSYVFHETKGQKPQEVVMLSVSKVEGTSAPVVTSNIREKIEALVQSEAYRDLTYTVVGDDGITAQNAIRGLTSNLISSIVIVGLLLLLFLSLRASVVVLVAIPLTLLIVFGLGFLFDQTINRVTLFALILSLGLLVDSAIVVVENMYVHLQRASEGVARANRELIIAGAVHEVGTGLFLSMITSVIVFLPMYYITGMMGPYMGPIAFFVPAALVVSLLVAIVVTPFIASLLIRTEEKKLSLTVLVDTYMQRIITSYLSILRYILRDRTKQKRILIGLSVLFVVSLLLPITGLVHFQMLPRADRDQFYVYVDAPVDTATEKTREVSTALSKVLLEDDAIDSIQHYVAEAPIVDFNGMFKGAQNRVASYQTTLRVNLVSGDERNKSSTDIVQEAREQMAKAYPEYVPYVRFIEEPPGPPVRATFVARVFSENQEVQASASKALFALIGSVDGVVDRYTSKEESVGKIEYTFEYEKAEPLGVSPQSVAETIRLLNGPVPVTEYLASNTGEYTPILVALPGDFSDEPADSAHLRVRTEKGTLIPIESVLKKTYVERNPKMYLERAQQLVYVTSEVENRSVVYVMLETLYRSITGELAGFTVTSWNLFSMQLQDTANNLVTISWGGEWEMTLENFRDLGVAMGVALLLVYAVLVAQYRSFSKPAYILITVPLGLIGVLWGFFLLDTFFGIPLTATALIGFIALIGIVVNNAIMYNEHVEQTQHEGLSFHDALVAAGEARLRPILLTSLTTVLGSLTIASDPVWSGLAWAIVFGLSLSTTLTLVIYPTLLAFFAPQDITT